MGRVKRLIIEGYRSIDLPIEIEFPEDVPLVLIGENNAGKSNIVRALDLILGERWPGSYDPDDHDFFGRRSENRRIEIAVEVEGVTGSNRVPRRFVWKFPTGDQRPYRVVFNDGTESIYVSNEMREQCACIVVSADRRLAQHLSYATKYTLLSKLTRKFHKALIADENRVSNLQEQFNLLSEIFRGVPEFTAFTKEFQRQVEEFSGTIEYALGMDFSAFDPSNYFRSLRVQPVENEEPRTFEELGTGQEQILAICLTYAYASTFYGTDGLLLVIEEPEAHLHPLAQRWVAQKLRELAQTGVQVVITTHSPAFLDVTGLPGWVRVYKRDGATKVIQLTAEKLAEYCRSTGGTRATSENILSFYAAGATEDILAGMFARKVFLVEGPSEALALPVYLSRVDLNPTQAGIAVISVGGKGNLARWWRLFTAFGIPCYVSFDNDKEDDKTGLKRTDVLSAIGFQGNLNHILETEDLEVEDTFAVFGNKFEPCMKRYFNPEYTRLEDDARNLHRLTSRDAKPLVARYVAERLKIDKYPDGYRKLRDLAECVQALTLSTESRIAARNLSPSTQEQSPVDDFDTEQDGEFDDVPF